MPFDKFSNSIFPGTKPQKPLDAESLFLADYISDRRRADSPVCNWIEIESKEKREKKEKRKNCENYKLQIRPVAFE